MFKLEIKTGGAAFRDECRTNRDGDYELDRSGHEVRRILKDIALKLEHGKDRGYIMDVNGNKVGSWKYE